MTSTKKVTVKPTKNNGSGEDQKIYLDELKFTSAFSTINKKVLIVPKVAPQQSIEKQKSEPEYEHFRDSMWLLILSGFLLGTITIVGFNAKKPSDVRFTVFSLRFIVVLVITSAQAAMSSICIYILLQNFTLFMLSYLAFYASACLINLSLIRVATKWPGVVSEISKSGLYKYTDPHCKRKCNMFVLVVMILAVAEHILAILDKLIPILNCQSSRPHHRIYSDLSFYWMYSIGFPSTIVAHILLQILTIISTLIQSYSDVFVICASIYLSSIFRRLNDKILKSTFENQSPSYWRRLREDYNQATHLVRCFDDAINTLVFISFASNLFFICFQLFKVLGHGIYKKFSETSAANITCNGVPLNIHSPEAPGFNLQAMYHVFSVVFLLGRFLVVTLATAGINNEAIAPTVALYNLPSTAYCNETERFLEQINNATVALSGLKFFYVTRSVLLSVAATIITYELVLMQYSDDFLL